MTGKTIIQRTHLVLAPVKTWFNIFPAACIILCKRIAAHVPS